MASKIDEHMGVYVLMAHLLITIGILAAYLYTVVIGQPDDTLRNLAILSAGYWFGSVSFQGVQAQKQAQKKVEQAAEQIATAQAAAPQPAPVAPVAPVAAAQPVQQVPSDLGPVVPPQQNRGNGQ